MHVVFLMGAPKAPTDADLTAPTADRVPDAASCARGGGGAQYQHHHHSGYGKPINTGFVLAIVDKLGGTFQGPNDFNKKDCNCPHCRPASVVEAARKVAHMPEQSAH